jgi:hypothetical protein
VNVYPFIEAEQALQRNVKRACELLESPVPPTTAIVPLPRRRVSAPTSTSARPTRRPRAATAHHGSTPSFADAAIGTPEGAWRGCCG